MTSTRIVMTALFVALLPSACGAGEPITLLSAFTGQEGARDGSAEILAFTSDEHTVLSTMSGRDGYGVQILTLTVDGTLRERRLVRFDAAFGPRVNVSSASSVAVDPAGRGFGTVALIPADSGRIRGKIAFFAYRSIAAGGASPIAALDVGFHPDSILFSPDGSMLFVANEGEFTSSGATDAPGSVSIVDLSTVECLSDIAKLTGGSVVDIDFSSPNLGEGVSLDGLRINDVTPAAQANRYRHIEPEYMCLQGNTLYVSLQENNAIGVLTVDRESLANSRWTAIHDLGTIANTIDASDRDGPDGTTAEQIDDRVKCLPMPDEIAAFERGGRRYLVSANEGDFRPDNGDLARVGSFSGVNTTLGSDDHSEAALGRLCVSTVDSDPDGDGVLDDVVAAGTRSISIWDAENGALVADTGSLEPLLLCLDPCSHNMDGNPDSMDSRSPDKGPEPEALTLAQTGGRVYAIAGMERQCGIVILDVSDPQYPCFCGYANGWSSGLVAPESLLYVSAADSPTGRSLLLVGCEGGGGAIGVYAVEMDRQGQPATQSTSANRCSRRIRAVFTLFSRPCFRNVLGWKRLSSLCRRNLREMCRWLEGRRRDLWTVRSWLQRFPIDSVVCKYYLKEDSTRN
jgi:hypothetical protein